MLENAQIIWIFQKNSLYLPTSKGNLWLSGQNPAREQDFIDTTPLFFLPKVLFDYPGRIPRGQDHIDTTQEKG